MKKLLRCIATLLVAFCGCLTAYGQTAVPMASQTNLTYTENFADVANWTSTLGSATGTGCNRFKGVAVTTGTSIPDGVKTTTATTGTIAASSSTSTSVQRGTGVLQFLATGTADNSAAIAADFLVDFTGVNAGTISFDWAEINNSTGNRNTSLQVYTSTDGSTFTALAGTFVTVANNVASSGSVTTVQLPSTFNGVSTAVIRFYVYNGTTTGSPASGSRPKISIDNLTVTATSSSTPTLSASGTLSAVNTTYGTASVTPTTFTVGGTSLTNNLVVTPPTGFEVSTSAGSGYGSTVTLTPSSGAVSNTTIYMRLAATTAAGTYGSAQNVVVSSTGATSQNVAAVASTVSTAALSITANNVTKTQGTTLTGGAGSTAFTSSGLKNSETIGTVTIAYGTGAAAGDAANTYTGQVTPSLATGGTFTASNYSITYNSGDIIVTSASPVILSSSPTLTAQSTTYGTASTAGTFNVSGTNMTAGILVTPPTGFEVSTDNSTFSSTVTVGSSGTISSTPVYVRLKASDIANSYSGNVALTSTGATEVDVAIASSTVSSVTPTATTNAATGITTTTATLNGSLTDGGATTTATFEYGTSSSTVSSGSGISVAATPSSVAAGAGSTPISASLTGLNAGTTYYYWAKGTNPASGTGSVLNFTTTFLAPTTQASNITFNSTSTTGTTVNWTNGDGSSRAVFIKAGSVAGTPAPVDGTTYTANTAYATGTQIGTTGWYCIYNGAGTSVTINGLAIGTSYQVMVDEYNGTGTGSKFLTTGSSATVTTAVLTPVTLAASPYTENFDNIGTNGLPSGFNVVTGATASAFGTSAPLSPAQVVWNNVSGAFKNVASNDGGLTQSSSQTGTNRALGIRQTGSFGDPGGSFVFQVANTSGKTAFKLSFSLQSLDNTSTRTTTWVVDYGIGSSPTTFTPITATTGTLTTGNSLFSNNTVTADFGSALDNQSGPITIRISVLAASTGSSNRATSGIDDFSLSWTVPSPIISYTSPQTYVQNNAITTLTPTSTYVAAPGFSTNAIGSAFARPAGVAMDASGNVYVADAGASSVYKMSPTGSGLTTIGSSIAGLGAIALDASGNMYVTEVTTGKLKKVTSGGVVTDIATFAMPTGVALDAAGNIYVADQSTNKVSEIASGTTTVTDIATGLSTPFGLTVDASANIYVVNQGNGKLQKIDATTHAVTDIVTISPGLTGLAMDGAGNLYYTNGADHSVNEIAQGTTTSTQLSTGFTTPAGLVVDATGNVFAADAINGGSVYKVARTGGYYITPALPAGLSMDGTTGAISGTPTAASAAANYAITGFNSAGGTSTTLNITVTGAPTINTTGTLSALSTTYGTASSAGTFSVSGTNLNAGILVTPPSGFEVSTDGTTYSSTVTVGAAGTVASTTVYIRLAATTGVGSSYSGNVVLSSTGATSVNVATATSTVSTAALTITANNVSKTYGDVLTGAAGSTAFTAPGLKNSETIGTVTIAYGTGAAATDAVNTYTGQVTPSAATGGTFNASNYNITYASGDITVGKAPLSVTANTANKSYGTTLTGASGSTAFTSSGLLNSETIGTVTLAYSTGSAATAAVNTYTGSVTPSAATGGTFNASNYNITYNTGDIVVGAANLTLTANTANKTYGATLTTGTGSTAFTPSGLANSETVGSVTMTYGTGSAATAAVNTYTGQATPSAATGGTFNANNYNITYTAADIVVGKATLDITANNVIKSVGTTITGGTGSAAFTSTGLQNSETIGSVTITYGSGSAAGDPVNTYTGSVVASAATGGTFTASNYTITYHAGDITVTAAPTPTISSSGTLSALTTTYGSASASATFSVSGANMSAGILVTPPTGFEVSTDNSTFSSTVTVGAAGTVSSTPIYIRLAATSAANTYLGNVVLSSTGAINVNVATASSTVNKALLTITANATSKTYGQTLTGGTVTTSAFTVTGTLKNSETITGATITYGTGAAATAGVNTYTGAVVPSAATGANGFSAGNYLITYTSNNITVTQAALTITASNANKTYGSALTGGAGSTAFTSSGLQNSETIGSVTLAYGTGSAANAAVNTYTAQVTPSVATGGTFTAGNYNITYNKGDIVVGKAALTITANTANKTYGTTLTGAVGSTAFTPTGLQNSETIGSVTMAYGTGSAATAAVNTYTGQVTPSLATGGTFAAGNYTITYTAGDIVVGAASLTITANNVNKTYGAALTGASGSTAFTSTGLANAETIGTVTIAYGTGSAATAAVNTYTGSVTPSAATGGTFNASNYSITYNPGNIIVGKAGLTITANDANKIYGTTLTGAAGSTAFTSAGLANSETIGSVTIAYGTGSAATAAVNTYTGSVIPSAATGGTFTAGNYNITYNSGSIIVGKASLTITANDVNKTYGAVLTGASGSAAFTSTGLVNSETIGSVTLTYGAGSAAAAAVNTYTGSVTPSAATGGTFTAGNYNITYTSGSIIVGKANLIITANNATKTYGSTLTGAAGSTAFTSSGLANSETIGSVTLAYGTGSAATDAVNTYTGSVTPSAATGGTFATGNYNITYASGNIIVGKANLTITGNNVSKAYGAALTGAAGSTAFTSAGLANNETIGSVTIAYGTGSAANAAGGTYTGSVAASAATGGTFTAANYNINYNAGNIIVTPITLTVTVSNASKVYGTANPAFAVNYAGFITGDNAASLTTQPTVTTTATATSGVGSYTLTAGGGASTSYTFVYSGTGTLTITPAPLTITADAKTKAYNTANPTLTATYTGFAGTDNASSLTTQPTFATTATTSSLPGTYPITVSGAASPNYTISYVAGVLTVVPGNNANLLSLFVSSGSLSPVFASATLAYTDTVANAVDRISFTPTLSDPAANLQVNGTQVGSGNNSTFILLKEGNNTITVLVTAQDGVTKNTYTITVYRASAVNNITASNVMSPNGDGKNDNWVIKDINLYPNNNVTVYDRGGRVVYTKHGYTNDWNGTLRGAPLAEGTYYYTVQLDPKLPVIKGYITILRTR